MLLIQKSCFDKCPSISAPSKATNRKLLIQFKGHISRLYKHFQNILKKTIEGYRILSLLEYNNLISLYTFQHEQCVPKWGSE